MTCSERDCKPCSRFILFYLQMCSSKSDVTLGHCWQKEFSQSRPLNSFVNCWKHLSKIFLCDFKEDSYRPDPQTSWRNSFHGLVVKVRQGPLSLHWDQDQYTLSVWHSERKLRLPLNFSKQSFCLPLGITAQLNGLSGPPGSSWRPGEIPDPSDGFPLYLQPHSVPSYSIGELHCSCSWSSLLGSHPWQWHWLC